MVAFVIELLATITEVVSLMTRTLALVVSNYRTSDTDHGSNDSNDRTLALAVGATTLIIGPWHKLLERQLRPSNY